MKTNIAIACALAMLAGFLMSRVLLSFATVMFGLNALWGIHPKNWLKNKWWLLGLVWVGIYIISGLWSDNMAEYNERVSVKLPVLLLPLAFSLLPPFTAKQLRIFTIGGAMLFIISLGYSVYFLLSDPGYYIEQYKFSKVMPTMAGHDYIRFSLSLALFIIWCFAVWPKLDSRPAKWFVGFVIFLLTIYVHVIAVKTGILVLYAFVFTWGLYITITRRRVLGLVLIVLLVASSVAAYKYVPTFGNKIDYFRYSMKMLKEGNYDSDYSDIGRLVSYDIALKLLKEYPIAGTGIGDLHDVMRTGYDKWYPKVPEVQRLKPHNQFLIVGLGCGIPALVVFVWWVFYPLKWVRRGRDGFFFFVMWLLMFIPLMVEPFLELQFGVYVYLFFLLWLAHNQQQGNKDLMTGK